ncbi:MAG: glutamine--fructose-6-phosphate transaminase (isomerizing) [Verrucomicrobiae bacterium]|nr:glutamine--fructose-6-phosphate transaminase (isomerizing) [Verrucomicrobiae bacterium]
MCGIIGFVGKRGAEPLLLEGLRRLEYRGYDSAGMCILSNGLLEVRKKKGRIDNLADLLSSRPLRGTIGIAHTRWATHGPPNDVNSHPHLDASGGIAVVHNGVIENYQELKSRMQKVGHKFLSLTDTEVLSHLIGEKYEEVATGKHKNGDTNPLVKAVRLALAEVIGTYGIAVVHKDHPSLIVGARKGSPLVLAVGKGENFIASDVSAIVAHTREVVYLQDYDIVAVTAEEFNVTTQTEKHVNRTVSTVEWTADSADKGSFPHYMLKEIYEQASTVENAFRGRIDKPESTAHIEGLNLTPQELRNADRIILTACGTAWHSALVGEYLFEELARVPVEVEYASEFRYRNPPMDKNTLVFVISQSGETADTLAALRESRRKGHKSMAIVNVVGSTIAREADGGIYMHAGPEIGVAATKSFTSQVTILTLLAIYMGRMRHLGAAQASQVIKELEALPDKIQQILKLNDHIRQIALKYKDAGDFLFLGRQFQYPVALEGALKLKEISYIHAEGYAAAEMKHGPIALVDKDTPSVFLVTRNTMYEKTISNLEEVKARSGPIIAVASEGDKDIAHKANDVIYVPPTLECLEPLLNVIPLQLLSYHIAVARGCDVDKPRNLAKSVTVE